jgi:hypothetical protein
MSIWILQKEGLYLTSHFIPKDLCRIWIMWKKIYIGCLIRSIISCRTVWIFVARACSFFSKFQNSILKF